MLSNRILAFAGIPLALIVAGLIVSIPAAAQTPAANKTPGASKATAAKRWRTPWGDPDLQGSWLNTAVTPLERPAKFQGREFMTPQERAEAEAKRAEGEKGSFYDPSYLDGRTSLIYDTPDGRMPPLTPEGQKRKTAWHESQRRDPPGPFNGPEDLNLRTRCIIRDPLPRVPANYVNGFDLVQTPGFVAITMEAIHDTRVIPLNGGPHLEQGVRQWYGDPRGHWEGDTLVVETTNFNDRTRFENSTQNMRLVERWTRIADDRIDYRFTVSDPATWTKPWSASIPWNKSGPIFEYACHEDNIDLYAFLSVARFNDRKAAEAAKKGTK